MMTHKRTFDFGKVTLPHQKRKVNSVSVTVELRVAECGEYVFSVCGEVLGPKGGLVCFGQCLDEIKGLIEDNDLFNRIYNLWKKYHLNDLHAGTKRQTEALVKAADKCRDKNGRIDYDHACEYLKSVGLYEDELAEDEILEYSANTDHDEAYDRKHYRYGKGWILWRIPADEIADIKSLLKV